MKSYFLFSFITVRRYGLSKNHAEWNKSLCPCILSQVCRVDTRNRKLLMQYCIALSCGAPRKLPKRFQHLAENPLFDEKLTVVLEYKITFVIPVMKFVQGLPKVSHMGFFNTLLESLIMVVHVRLILDYSLFADITGVFSPASDLCHILLWTLLSSSSSYSGLSHGDMIYPACSRSSSSFFPQRDIH